MEVFKTEASIIDFINWFGNMRDGMEVDLELAMECPNHFPFTEEQMELWQKCGFIKVSKVKVNDSFKPVQKIILNFYPHNRSPKTIVDEMNGYEWE